MAKESGLGDRLLVAGYDVSGDIGALDTIGAPLNPLDVTSIAVQAMERIGGLRDGNIKFTAFFNPDPLSLSGSHTRFSTLPTTDVQVAYLHLHGANTIGRQAAVTVAKQLDYAGKRANDGAMTFDIECQASAGTGLEWGVMLTPGKRTDTAATDGASLDGLAATAFGLQAYLQVLSFTGTSVTIKLQDSADDVTFADITSATFGAQTAIGASRIQTGRTAAVRRYTRVVTTGTFSECTFAVIFVRNDVRVDL